MLIALRCGEPRALLNEAEKISFSIKYRSAVWHAVELAAFTVESVFFNF